MLHAPVVVARVALRPRARAQPLKAASRRITSCSAGGKGENAQPALGRRNVVAISSGVVAAQILSALEARAEGEAAVSSV